MSHQNESFERINEHMNQIVNEFGKTFSEDYFGPSLITHFFSDPFFYNNNLMNNRNYPNNNFGNTNYNYQDDPNHHNHPYNNWNPDNRFIDPIDIASVFRLSGLNPDLDEFFNAVNNNFNAGFGGNNYQQGNFPGNQNPNYNQNYSRQNRNGNFAAANNNFNNKNLQEQLQQNVNYRDTKIYDV